MKYDEDTVGKEYKDNLSKAHQQLASLPFAEGRKPNVAGLNGWVYEQTIRHCLSQEFISRGLSPIIKEQVPLYGRAKIDLLVGTVAIEIKAAGSFGDDARKYSEYRAKVEEKGWVYFYLTGGETVKRYRSAAEEAFGENRAFFLDTKGDWERFVREVIRSCEEKP